MNISSRCEYALRAVLALARRHGSEPMTSTAIAEERNIPENYLVHIMLQLKKAGLVRSVRGAQGGYLLARSPNAITLHDVVTAVDGPILEPLPVEASGSEDLAPAWADVARAVGEVLSEITVQSIADRSQADMYYI